MTSTAAAPAAADRRILVWDLPTRLFHWLLVGSFALAYATSESETWRALHVLAGYTAGGLIAFRLLWGVLGTRYARFTGFTFAPSAVFAYFRSLLTGRPQHYAGHNPAGSWAVLALLGLVAATAGTGFAQFNELGGEWLEDLHEFLANATLALVAVHVIAVIVSSFLHRENLARAMVGGRKLGHGGAPAAGTRWPVGLLLVAAVAALWLGFIPAPGLARGEPGMAALTALARPGTAGLRDGDRRERTGRAERRRDRDGRRNGRDRDHD